MGLSGSFSSFSIIVDAGAFGINVDDDEDVTSAATVVVDVSFNVVVVLVVVASEMRDSICKSSNTTASLGSDRVRSNTGNKFTV